MKAFQIILQQMLILSESRELQNVTKRSWTRVGRGYPGGGSGGIDGHGVEDAHQSGENTLLPVLVKNIWRWVAFWGAIAIMLVNNQVSCVIRAWGNCCISCLECEETAACLLFPSIHELSIVSATRRDSSPKLRQFIHLVDAAHETEKQKNTGYVETFPGPLLNN